MAAPGWFGSVLMPPVGYSWAAAKTYCANLSLAAATGWRLPWLEDLFSLVDPTVAPPGPTLDLLAFPNTPGEVFWSASPDVNADNLAWAVTFQIGDNVGRLKTDPLWVRCVR